jgi:acetyl esterase/lipase
VGATGRRVEAVTGDGTAVNHKFLPRRSSLPSRPIGGRVSALAVLLLAWRALGAEPPAPILLWPNGAPGPAGRGGAEVVRLSDRGEHILSNIQAPSLTPFVPGQGAATGAAFVVIPGGGHRELWMDHEGYRVAEFLVAHGIAAFVLKYRLAGESGSPYTVDRDELADVQRALRLIRSRAGEWGVDPSRLGVIGFSAGGELATLAATRFDAGTPAAPDPVDRMGSRPSFAALIYPGIRSDVAVPRDAPPAFLLCGGADLPAIALGLADLYRDFSRAGVPTELHVYAGVGHGFGIRPADVGPIAAWPERLVDWLGARGFLVRH